jgi:hypothetical protein
MYSRIGTQDARNASKYYTHTEHILYCIELCTGYHPTASSHKLFCGTVPLSHKFYMNQKADFLGTRIFRFFIKKIPIRRPEADANLSRQM